MGPFLSRWLSIAIQASSDRMKTRSVVRKVRRRTLRVTMARWRVRWMKEGYWRRIVGIIHDRNERLRQSRALFSWMRALDSKYCRQKYDIVRSRLSRRLRRKVLHIWRQLLAACEFRRCSLQVVAWESWNTFVSWKFRLQRADVVADKHFLRRGARLWLRLLARYIRWWRWIRRRTRNARSVILVTKCRLHLKSWIRFLHECQRSRGRDSRRTQCLRDRARAPLGPLLFEQHAFRRRPVTTRSMALFRAVRCWLRKVASRRRKRTWRQKRMLLHAWRRSAVRGRMSRRAFVERLGTFMWRDTLRFFLSKLKRHVQQKRMHRTLGTYFSLLEKSRIWACWRKAFRRRRAEERQLRVLAHWANTSKLRLCWLHWRAFTGPGVALGRLFLVKHALHRWRLGARAVRHHRLVTTRNILYAWLHMLRTKHAMIATWNRKRHMVTLLMTRYTLSLFVCRAELNRKTF